MVPATDRPGPGRTSRPYWLGLVVIGLGAVWVHGGLALPQVVTYAVVGPGLFPTVIGCGLVVLGLLLLVAVARGERFEPQEAEDADATRPVDRRALWTTVAASVLPIPLLKPLGFPLAAALAFATVARAFGSTRPPVDLLYGLILGSACWLLFSRFLGLDLPGPWPLPFR